MGFRFLPPGKLTDMNAATAEQWHARVNSFIENGKVPSDASYAGSRNQFFNPADGLDADAITKNIGWTAFPRPLLISSGSDEERWAIAESDRQEQVEYCEWSTTRDPAGNVLKITFTCEDRDYFSILFENQPDTVLDLYRQYVSPSVEMTDLQNSLGAYISANKWNSSTSSGAMHMIGRPNTIGAAVELVAGASVVRTNADGSYKTGARELILCGGYGDVERHSDPTIGAEVNELTRAAHYVSLANPAELSFESISFAGWQTPDGSPPDACWRYTRGVDGHYVRGELEVPADKSFTVGDIKINGLPIRYGGQVADAIRIKVSGLAHRLGQATIEPVQGCLDDPLPGATGAGLVEGTIRSARKKSLRYRRI